MNTAERLLGDLERTEATYRASLEFACQAAPVIFRGVRQKYGWSLRDLGKKLDCDFTYLSKIENGHYPPGKPLLRKLIALLKQEGK